MEMGTSAVCVIMGILECAVPALKRPISGIFIFFSIFLAGDGELLCVGWGERERGTLEEARLRREARRDLI